MLCFQNFKQTDIVLAAANHFIKITAKILRFKLYNKLIFNTDAILKTCVVLYSNFRFSTTLK